MTRFFSMRLNLVLPLCALTASLFSGYAAAQTAVRCDVNGKAVYSDQPCLPGLANKAAINTQETAEQRAAAKAANDQIRKDNVAVDKRLDDRYKRDTAHSTPRVAYVATGAVKRNRLVLDNDTQRGKAKAKAKSKSAKAKRAAKAAKAEKAMQPKQPKQRKDNKVYRSKARV